MYIYNLSIVQDTVDSIIKALQDFFGNLGNAVLDIIIWLLSNAIKILFFPIDLLFSTFFSGLTNSINTITTNINNFISNVSNFPISLFVNILPNLTKTALLIYLSFLIVYYGFSFAYRAVRVSINIFHKIKFW